MLWKKKKPEQAAVTTEGKALSAVPKQKKKGFSPKKAVKTAVGTKALWKKRRARAAHIVSAVQAVIRIVNAFDQTTIYRK